MHLIKIKIKEIHHKKRIKKENKIKERKEKKEEE